MEIEPIIGKVIQRNFVDLSITVKSRNSRKVKVNLTLWLQAQQNQYNDKKVISLPHTNNCIRIKNVKFIKIHKDDDQLVDYMIGNASTIIEPLADNNSNQHNIWDNFYAAADMSDVVSLQDESGSNVLHVIEQNNLTEKHLEVFIWLPTMFPGLENSEMYNFALFRALSNEGIMKNMSLNARNEIYLNSDPFFFQTVTSIGAITQMNARLKEVLNNAQNKMPYFGNRQSQPNECLIGLLTSKLGKLRLEDGTTSVVIHMKSWHNSAALQFCNCLVVVLKYHILAEIYPDGVAECLFVDLIDVRLLLSNLKDANGHFEKCVPPAIVETVQDIPLNLNDYYQYQFIIEAIAPVNKVNKQDGVEAWLKIQNLQHVSEPVTRQEVNYGDYYKANGCLILGEEYLSTVTFLDVGRTYVLFTPQPLQVSGQNSEVLRFSEKYKGLKLTCPGSYFLPTQNLSHIQVLRALPSEASTVNILATLEHHFLNDSDDQNTSKAEVKSSYQLGMLAKGFQHRLSLSLSEGPSGNSVPMYLKNWEVKQTPEGLHPNVILLITNVYFTGRYLNNNVFMNIKVVGVKDALKEYKTANFLQENSGLIPYESLPALDKLDLKYFVYLRTIVYVQEFTGVVNLGRKALNFKFIVLDENGVSIKVQCTKYKLLYKFMEIFDDEEIQRRECRALYEREINLNELEQDNELQSKLPFVYVFLQHLSYKMNFGLVSMDVLCKKWIGGNWSIEDVYNIN